MGMFDYIQCDYPLPDNFVPPRDYEFQTKDTPRQCILNYIITAEGELSLHGEVCNYTGCINFYGSNIVWTYSGYYVTKHDAPLLNKSYNAYFDAGILLSIECVEEKDDYLLTCKRVSREQMKDIRDIDIRGHLIE